jgi:sigma-B regulation protein RsbU (phosphoserine phosphatase)
MDRILVADDQPDVVEALRLLLKNEGFVMDAASSPQTVMEALRCRNYDLLLLDMNYTRDTTSGGEGLELLSRIHQLDDTLPVVLMTAWSSVGLAVAAMRTGGYDFVEKPWDNRTLVGTLRRHIEQSRLKREKEKTPRIATNVFHDIEEARQTQRRMLPVEMPEHQGIEIRAAWRPAEDLGGDYFDVIRVGENVLAICIADVSGKGLPAALVMSNLQAAVRAYAQSDRSPSEMCRQLNRVICENTGTERYVTMFYALLDTVRHSITYANAGHVPPILIQRDGFQEKLSTGGTVLGLFADRQYEEASVTLHPGDHLVLLTDGITEAVNANGEQFCENGQMAELLRQNRELTSAQLRDTLLSAVNSFAGQNLQDDATLMVVSRHC